jgi:septal ring factor EnvC (AmiA/AmiB activator)
MVLISSVKLHEFAVFWNYIRKKNFIGNVWFRVLFSLILGVNLVILDWGDAEMDNEMIEKIWDKIERTDMYISNEVATKAEVNALRLELKSEMQEMRLELSELKTDVAELKTDVAEIKVTLTKMQEMSSNVQTLVDRQMDIIDLLSARSIEHEAFLKRIK